MAYVDTHTANRKVGTLTAVALIHVAAGYVLVNGLASDAQRIIDTTIKTIFVPENKPVPQKPEQKPREMPRTVQHYRAPEPIVPSPPNFTTIANNPAELTGGTGDGLGSSLEEVHLTPIPTPSPSFAVRGARPRGNPGQWVTTNDYPTGELRLEHTGLTRFRLAISAEGRVTSCTITSTSGWPALDAAACAKLASRAKFDPALDSTGATSSGSYSGAVRWQMPE